MQKKCVCSFLFLRFGLILFLKREKKDLLFPLFSCVSGPRKKNLFGDEMHAKKRFFSLSPRFPHFLHKKTSSSTMAASSLTAAALGSKVAFANKVRLMNNASFRLWLFFLFLVSFRARARCTRKGTHEREIIFSVKFYHLSLEKLSSQTNARKRGYKTHSFPTKSARLAT